MDNELGSSEVTAQEEAKLRILAQKKEKKIKIIRILTVIAYLVTVSSVAAALSAYYIFVWDPHAANNTQIQPPNAERLVMAMQKASGEYVFADTSGDHQQYTDTGNFVSEVLNSRKANDRTDRPESSIQFLTTTIKSSTSPIQALENNVSESISVST